MSKRMLHATFVLMAALAAAFLASCGGASSSSKSNATPVTDTADSEVAIGIAAGATGSDDGGSGVAIQSRKPLDWIANHLAFERIAYAAGFACGSGTWTGPGTTSQTYSPPNCTITYGNGSQTTLSWSGGPWDLVFSNCTPPTHFLVNSGCSSGANVVWSTGAAITRTWTGPLGNTYAVTTDAGSGASSGTWNVPKNSAGTLVTCTSTPCPAAGSSTGTRTIDIGDLTGASHITGTYNGSPRWDHTVYTTTSLTIVGAGANRVINGGTIVVEHNLAHKVFTTTFNGPLIHEANCAFPISGSVTTTVQSAGSDNGKTETVTFSSTCGVATVMKTDGTQATWYLSLVL